MKNIKTYGDFCNEAKIADYEKKDLDRIKGIVKRSTITKGIPKELEDEEVGRTEKQLQLATAMANKITDYDKAIRRGNAAQHLDYHDIAEIFFKRARKIKRESK